MLKWSLRLVITYYYITFADVIKTKVIMTNIELRFYEVMISSIQSIAKSLKTLAENDTERLKMEKKKRIYGID